MKVLLVHERYRQHGGEDVVVDTEARLLADHGHRVLRYERDNAEIDEYGRLQRARLAVRTVWAADVARDLGRLIGAERPDVAHVHNTFPLLSPAVIATCHRAGVPVVQTLHNYRLVCPEARCFRDGAPCEDCVGRRVAWPGVVHGCYQGSRARSAVVASMLATHSVLGTWDRKVDLYIAPSVAARQTLVEGGLAQDRMVLVPHVVDAPDPAPPSSSPPEPYALFAGRLSAEKGADVLVDAAGRAGEVQVRVVGDGPERPSGAAPNVELLGARPHAEVIELMRSARVVVVPSRWRETFGLVVAEAYACGVPVIASAIGALTELVDDGRTGWLVPPGDPISLAERLRWSWTHHREVAAAGRAARQAWEQRYSPAAGYPRLVDAFQRATGTRRAS